MVHTANILTRYWQHITPPKPLCGSYTQPVQGRHRYDLFFNKRQTRIKYY